MARNRVRIRFRKEGDLRWISHRDLARTWERLLRRAGAELSMSEGFHPHPRISFPSALPLGVAAGDEVMEIELVEPVDVDDLRRNLASQAPPGLAIDAIEAIAAGVKKAAVRCAEYELPVPASHAEAVAEQIARIRTADRYPLDRGDGQPPLDLCRDLESIEFTGGVLRFRLRVPRERAVRPREVLALLGLTELEHQGAVLTRTRVELES